MDGTPASFSELAGVGPLTEARLHEAGIHSWPALATVVDALDGLRSAGRDPLRRLSRQVAERVAEVGAATDGERSEAFVVRMALDAAGRPVRTLVTHARTSAELLRPGWTPDDVVRFVEDCAGLWLSTAPSETEPADEDARHERLASRDHVVDLDLGRGLGKTAHDVDLTLAVGPAVPADVRVLRVVADLRARPYGPERPPWSDLARRRADVDDAGLVALRFDGLSLPRGLYRFGLRVAVHLTGPSAESPRITLR